MNYKSIIQSLTIEGALMIFVIIYLALQYMDPVFIVFKIFADMVLYLAIGVGGIIAAYLISHLVYELGKNLLARANEWKDDVKWCYNNRVLVKYGLKKWWLESLYDLKTKILETRDKIREKAPFVSKKDEFEWISEDNLE